MSPYEQEMNDCESLPEVKRQETRVKIEGVDGGSVLNMQELLAKRSKEAFIKEQSSTDSYSGPLHISTTTKPSKVVAKKDSQEQHHVCIHINSKPDNTAFHLDHVMHVLGDCPPQVIVDEENCKSSAAISSVELEKELTWEDAIVKQSASGQDQCSDSVYAVVDKTRKKRQPTKVNKAVWLSILIVL